MKNLYQEFVQNFPDDKPRCFGGNKDFYAFYHDTEWGIPKYDDQILFEMLILEGAQAGLSWETVLKKREGYRQAFHHFDVKKVAEMTDEALEALRDNPDIIRNKLKIYAARKNALAFMKIQQEFGSFSDYIWKYVNHKPIINTWDTLKHIPASNEISDAISKDLKKRGMTFVGSTIIYAFMQSIGMVNDHPKNCWLHHQNLSSKH